MLRQSSVPPMDQVFKGQGNPFLFSVGGEVFPRPFCVGRSWTPRPACAPRRWTQPVNGSQREAPIIGRSSLPATLSHQMPGHSSGCNLLPLSRVSKTGISVAAPSRSASVGALRSPPIFCAEYAAHLGNGQVSQVPSAGQLQFHAGVPSSAEGIQLTIRTPRGLPEHAEPSTPFAAHNVRSCSAGPLRLPVYCPENGQGPQAQPSQVPSARQPESCGGDAPADRLQAAEPRASANGQSLPCNESWSESNVMLSSRLACHMTADAADICFSYLTYLTLFNYSSTKEATAGPMVPSFSMIQRPTAKADVEAQLQ